jgi:outer membrane receptor protein involved in Fe transport
MSRIAAVLLCGAALAGTPGYRGLLLTEALERLQAQGLRLIYSSAVVGEDLVVSVEPKATRPRAVLAEILGPLGLEVRDGPGGALLIVTSDRPARGSLRGRVVSEARRRPIARAGITIAGSPEAGAVTDPDGVFELRDLPAGAHRVTIAAEGFLDRTIAHVEVAPGATEWLQVSLQALPTHVEEIVVTPGRHAVIREEQAAAHTLRGDDTTIVPNMGGDVSRVVEQLPGVTAPDHSAAFHLRGSTARDVSFVLDGLELYAPFHLGSFQSPFSFIDAEMVEAVDVVAGGFTAEMGDRHGGFVELATGPADPPPRSGIELGSLHTRASHATPLASGSLLVSARAWYPEELRATTQLGEDGLDPRFQDVYAKGTWALNPNTVLSAHALWAGDRIRFVESDGGERVTADSTSGHGWVRALRSWSPAVSTDTVLSAGRLRRVRGGISEPEDVPTPVEDERTVDFFGLRHDLAWERSPAGLLKAGFEVRPLRAEYRRNGQTLAPGGTSLAAYLAHRSGLSEALAVELGMRWERQTYTGDTQWSPRAHAAWRPTERTEVKVALGAYSQSQRIYELRIEDGETEFLPAERSRQVEATLLHCFGDALSLRVDAYDHRLSRLHPRYENRWNPLELFPETEQDRVLVAPERARLRGVELLLRGDAGRAFHWWASYARASAKDVIGGEDVPRSWDQPHAGRALVAYRWGPGWSVSLAGTARTGWPTTPVWGRLTEGEPEAVAGARNSARFAAYARLDAKVSRTFSMGRGRLRLQLEVLNVTDRANVCCVDELLLTPQDDGTVTVDRELDTWLGITPSFGALFEF